MKINRSTLTLIVASLCGVGPTVAFGQDALSEAARSSAGRIADSAGVSKPQTGASQSLSDAGEVKAPALKSPSDRVASGAYSTATYPATGAYTAPAVRGGSDCTSPGCTTPGCDSSGCDSRVMGSKVFGARHLGLGGSCDSGSCGTGGSCESGGLLSGLGGACGVGACGPGAAGSGLG